MSRLATQKFAATAFVAAASRHQGCQMFFFKPKNPNLGKFWRALPRLENVYIFLWPFGIFLWRFGIFYVHLVHFVFIWYIFSGFGIMHQEKSGNPADATTFLRKFEPHLKLLLVCCRDAAIFWNTEQGRVGKDLQQI
jgi:hypothetical protein